MKRRSIAASLFALVLSACMLMLTSCATNANANGNAAPGNSAGCDGTTYPYCLSNDVGGSVAPTLVAFGTQYSWSGNLPFSVTTPDGSPIPAGTSIALLFISPNSACGATPGPSGSQYDPGCTDLNGGDVNANNVVTANGQVNIPFTIGGSSTWCVFNQTEEVIAYFNNNTTQAVAMQSQFSWVPGGSCPTLSSGLDSKGSEDGAESKR